MRSIGIIPARFDSTRFPGKPLVDIGGKSMIQRVFERASKCAALEKVIVATDDDRIFSHCQELQISVQMTSSDHQSGTDRCAEIASMIDADIIVNIQGDEPFLYPNQIDQVINCFSNEQCDIATLVKQDDDIKVLSNPNRVKCVLDSNGKALLFSRSVIPFDRNSTHPVYYRHIGLYAYRRDVLLQISKLEPSSLELAESLEQLRWLQNGYSIFTDVTDQESPNVDTPADLEAIKGSL